MSIRYTAVETNRRESGNVVYDLFIRGNLAASGSHDEIVRMVRERMKPGDTYQERKFRVMSYEDVMADMESERRFRSGE